MEADLTWASLSVLSVEGCRCPRKREVAERAETDRGWVLWVPPSAHGPTLLFALLLVCFSHEVSIAQTDL